MPLATTEKGVEDTIGIVSKMRALVGASRDVTAMQLEIEAMFIKDNYAEYSLLDFQLAMKLFLNNFLDVPVPSYVNFSSLFIAYIMNAYIRYKKKLVSDIVQAAEPKMLVLEQSTNQERLDGLKDCIRECAVHALDEFNERFFNGVVYDFLRRTKRMKLYDKIIYEARQYAERKFLEDRQKNIDAAKVKGPKKIGDAMKTNPAAIHSKSDALELYCKDYCLINYFQNVDLNNILDSILETELPNKE